MKDFFLISLNRENPFLSSTKQLWLGGANALSHPPGYASGEHRVDSNYPDGGQLLLSELPIYLISVEKTLDVNLTFDKNSGCSQHRMDSNHPNDARGSTLAFSANYFINFQLKYL